MQEIVEIVVIFLGTAAIVLGGIGIYKLICGVIDRIKRW